MKNIAELITGLIILVSVIGIIVSIISWFG